MNKNQLIIILLALAGLVQGQSIITPPNDTIEVIGTTASFHCEMDLGENPVMAWDHNDKAIYSFYAGEEKYRMDDNQYLVTQDGRNFNLTVNRLKYRDGGTYTCRTIVSYATANLIVLDHPDLITHPQSLKAWKPGFFSCVAHFGGPRKRDMSAHLYPQVQMYLNGSRMEGEVTEQEPEGDIEHHILRQDHQIMVEPNMDGMMVTCDITTRKPMKQMTASTKIVVQLPHVNDTGQPPNKNRGTEEPYSDEDGRKPGEDANAFTWKQVILVAGISTITVLVIMAVVRLIIYVIGKQFSTKRKKEGPKNTGDSYKPVPKSHDGAKA